MSGKSSSSKPKSSSKSASPKPADNKPLVIALVVGCVFLLVFTCLLSFVLLGFWAYRNAENATLEPLDVEEDPYDFDDYDWDDDFWDDDWDNDSDDSDTGDSSDDSGSSTYEYEEGTVEGSLSYPSEGIPEDMMVCARAPIAASAFCTDEHIISTEYTYGEGYKLTVPYGSYYVYAQVPGDDYEAYYTEYVTCGMGVGCDSHDLILVTVNEENPDLTEIDPIDWYMPEE